MRTGKLKFSKLLTLIVLGLMTLVAAIDVGMLAGQNYFSFFFALIGLGP